MTWKPWWEIAGLTEAEAQVALRALHAYERRVRGAHSRGHGHPSELMNRVRFAKKARRRVQKSFGIRRPRNLTLEQLLMQRSDNAIINGLYPSRARDWLGVMNRVRQSEIELENLSFLDNPSQTIATLREVVKVECFASAARLNFEDKYCHDIGPYLVLEAMWRNMAPIYLGGAIGAAVARVLEAVALRRVLGWRPLHAPTDTEIIPFPFRRQERPAEAERSTGIEPSRSAKIVSDFVGFIDETLARACDAQLSEDGNAWFGSMIGEVLDNAETHGAATTDGGYSTAGFMSARRVNGVETFRFHLGFLSPGQTISEGLELAPAPIRPQMESYVRRHVSRTRTAENLRTVFALQDGVSRLDDKYDVVNGKSLGGTGLADILQFHRSLNSMAADENEPKLAIISGSTYILIKEPYRVAIAQPGEKAREIWFNTRNSPEDPPDQEHVFSLPERDIDYDGL